MHPQKQFIALACFYLVTHAALAAPSGSLKNTRLNCQVVGISDGDTITCLAANTPHRIRLAGIDAPESKQAYGRRAKQALSQYIYRRDVHIRISDTDRYGRLVGTVYLDGSDINRQMITSGWAWAYRRYAGAGYINAEATARRQKRGLWQDANPVYPQDFRHRRQE